MKRFVVMISGLPKAEEANFLEHIKLQRWGWWKRIDGVWLITDETDNATATEIRDFLSAMRTGKAGLVIEVPKSATWAGTAPSRTLKDTFDWLYRNWTPHAPD